MNTDKRAQQGFSLIELMIVVAIIGILAAIAIPAFLKYMEKSKSTEARLQLNAIGKHAKTHWIEHTSFPVGVATRTPSKPGSGGCCGTPSNRCAKDIAAWHADPVWSALGQEIDGESLYYYDYAGTASNFVATATGDVNCNGREAVFTLTGDSTGGTPSVALSDPPPNAE